MALNDKQEKFAQAYVLYRNATEAAKAAGYAGRSAYNQGSRLLKIGEVNERIEDLEKEMETSIDYVAEIEKQYTYATNNNHTNSALKALELLSRLRAPTDEDTPTTVEELEEDIVKSLELLGEDRTIKLFTKCSWFDEQEEEMEELQEEVEELEEILDELAEGEIIDDQV
jgi:phage terminase small subunit|tara:strand:- start:4707 stop:5216 length:510 start_codon:yes stop_codon:yes gene_type:complete